MSDRALAQMEDRFEQRIGDLEERVEDLEDELADERDRRRRAERAAAEAERELTERVDGVEDTADFNQRSIFNLEDTVTGTYDGGAASALLTDMSDGHGVVDALEAVEGRVEAIERGEIDPGEVVAESGGPGVEELLPIHQNYLAVRHVDGNEHGLTQNQELAARVFPHWSEKADPSGGTLTLTSGQVRRIIETEIDTPEHRKRLDTENPNPNTIRRVMKFLGQFGGELIELNRDPKTNRLEANRDDWVSYAETVVDATSDDTSAASTSAGGTPRATTDGGREIERR